jgi:hypothetical protein
MTVLFCLLFYKHYKTAVMRAIDPLKTTWCTHPNQSIAFCALKGQNNIGSFADKGKRNSLDYRQ